MNYSVFFVRVKNRYVETQNAKWVICIKDEKKWNSIENEPERRAQIKLIFSKRPRQYRNIATEVETPIIAEGLRSAYETALDLRDKHRREGRLVKIHATEKISSCRVYLFRLNQTVWKDKSYIKFNSHVNLDNPPEAFYVGMTSLSIEERYGRHQATPVDQKDITTKWGKTYFLQSFVKSFDEAAQKLRDEFSQTTATHRGVEDLNFWEAQINELEFAEWLRSQGYGAYAK